MVGPFGGQDMRWVERRRSSLLYEGEIGELALKVIRLKPRVRRCTRAKAIRLRRRVRRGLRSTISSSDALSSAFVLHSLLPTVVWKEITGSTPLKSQQAPLV